MVKGLKKNISPLPVGKYGKLTLWSTRRHYEPDAGKSAIEAERFRALWVVHSMQSRKKLPSEKQWETHFLSHDQNKKWIEDFVERETAVARKQVEDAEAAIRQE